MYSLYMLWEMNKWITCIILSTNSYFKWMLNGFEGTSHIKNYHSVWNEQHWIIRKLDYKSM